MALKGFWTRIIIASKNSTALAHTAVSAVATVGVDKCQNKFQTFRCSLLNSWKHTETDSTLTPLHTY